PTQSNSTWPPYSTNSTPLRAPKLSRRLFAAGSCPCRPRAERHARRTASARAHRESPLRNAAAPTPLTAQTHAPASRARPSPPGLLLLHLGIRPLATLSNETIDAGSQYRQRYGPQLQHRIVERADVELRSERVLGLVPLLHDRTFAQVVGKR